MSRKGTTREPRAVEPPPITVLTVTITCVGDQLDYRFSSTKALPKTKTAYNRSTIDLRLAYTAKYLIDEVLGRGDEEGAA